MPQPIHVFSDSPLPHAAARRRILSSRAFRRLAHKTQVIALPADDHLSTRLTHTLEVASVARDIASSLRHAIDLHLDLVEAIALAHDVGHAPFGHAGEAALARRAADAGLGGFHHAAFGVRLLSRIEIATDGAPVVADADVIDGVLAHSKGRSGAAFARGAASLRRSFEARIVRAADLYAYAAVDLDDAVRLRLFDGRSIPARARRELGKDGESIRRSLIRRTVEATLASFASGGPPALELDSEGDAALSELRAFLYERFYEGPPTADQTRRADDVIGTIWRAFQGDLAGTLDAAGWSRREDGSGRPSMRDALDALACMTDRFAVAFAASCALQGRRCGSRSPVLTER